MGRPALLDHKALFIAPESRLRVCKSAIRLSNGEILQGSRFKSIGPPSASRRVLEFQDIVATEELQVMGAILLDHDDRLIRETVFHGGHLLIDPGSTLKITHIFTASHGFECPAPGRNAMQECTCKWN